MHLFGGGGGGGGRGDCGCGFRPCCSNVFNFLGNNCRSYVNSGRQKNRTKNFPQEIF